MGAINRRDRMTGTLGMRSVCVTLRLRATPRGKAREALYTLEQQLDDSLKITGCSLLKAGQSA